jgi:quercetin dioxygenase-like cupin family protein
MSKTQSSAQKQSQLIILKSAADTQGELLEVEATYPANSPQPPYHFHPYQEEQFEVLKGKFRVKINQGEIICQVGDRFSVPVSAPHWMHNISNSPGQLNWQVRPALKTQSFLETMWGLNVDGNTNPKGVPNLLQLAVILNTYSKEFRATIPPYFIQRRAEISNPLNLY